MLAGPALIVCWPALLRGMLRGVGALGGPSPLLDPIPELAARVGPWVAWLSVVPLGTTLYNLRMPLPTAARWTLRAFVLLHVGVIAWWLWAVLG